MQSLNRYGRRVPPQRNDTKKLEGNKMKRRHVNVFRSIFICSFVMMVILGFTGTVFATNGYFAHGYSVKNKALAGAGTALPLDSLAASTNPAGMVFVGKRIDFGLTFFNPNREYTVKGNPSGFPGTFGFEPGTVESDSKWFIFINGDRPDAVICGPNLCQKTAPRACSRYKPHFCLSELRAIRLTNSWRPGFFQ